MFNDELFCDKFGVEKVFGAVEIKKDNLDDLKELIWDAISYSCGFSDDEEEKLFDSRCADCLEIKTVKGLREYLKKYDICDLYDFKIWRNYLVSF